MSVLTPLYSSDRIAQILREVSTTSLAEHLAGSPSIPVDPNPVAPLRVAAIAAFADYVSDQTVEALARTPSHAGGQDGEGRALGLLDCWSGYVTSLLSSGTMPSLADTTIFCAIGLKSRQPTEIRAILRQSSAHVARPDHIEVWPQHLRDTISAALLHLVVQRDHEDLRQAASLIDALPEAQKTSESLWLEQSSSASRDAILLLSLYHIAHAVRQLSKFLLSGAISDGDGTRRDFEPELKRLLSRASEYAELLSDSEYTLWLKATAIILSSLRSDSVWVRARGISDKIDRLLDALTSESRERPLFSLLPSQQDALHQNLLDAARIATILQMPTNTGKTLLAEFSIVQTLEAYRNEARVAYVCPTRALATQVRRSLAQDLRPIGIEVSPAGGAFEEDEYELQLLNPNDNVIVATPERLDLLLRAHQDWFSSLRLIVVDEAHLLQDSERGVRLELLLANIRREYPLARLLLLTPFVQNAQEVASWLGGARGQSIQVHWRPAQILLGITSPPRGSGASKTIEIEWNDPLTLRASPAPTILPSPAGSSASARARLVHLASVLRPLGTVLGLFSASRQDAEKAAVEVANLRQPISGRDQTPALRVAAALARDDYGEQSTLAHCIERGIAFHHSALSSNLRYLVEQLIADRVVEFAACTTTLAQGMNFPVASVVIHSVHKPYGAGDLSPAEFWNIAGRTARIGLADEGYVVFANHQHRSKWVDYSQKATETIRSALLYCVEHLKGAASLKELYRQHEELRPFFQYLAHAAASTTPAQAAADIEELLQASLAGFQEERSAATRRFRDLARQYLSELGGNVAYLKVVDTTGLGSFSFNELFAKIGDDSLLRRGPGEVLRSGETGIAHLIEALKWLPELGLGIGHGSGPMDVHGVARVVQGWIDGKKVSELAREFPGATAEDRCRNASTYVHGLVANTVSWGAHAYIKGWGLRSNQESSATETMLPTYIQYGVRSPEAAVASLLGVPRALAEPLAMEYREAHGHLTPDGATQFRAYVEHAGLGVWERVVGRSRMRDQVSAGDVMSVWRSMQGMASRDMQAAEVSAS